MANGIPGISVFMLYDHSPGLTPGLSACRLAWAATLSSLPSSARAGAPATTTTASPATSDADRRFFMLGSPTGCEADRSLPRLQPACRDRRHIATAVQSGEDSKSGIH